jgi:hypothetical protein
MSLFNSRDLQDMLQKRQELEARLIKGLELATQKCALLEKELNTYKGDIF